MMQLKHGIIDEASISVIPVDRVREIGRRKTVLSLFSASHRYLTVSMCSART